MTNWMDVLWFDLAWNTWKHERILKEFWNNNLMNTGIWSNSFCWSELKVYLKVEGRAGCHKWLVEVKALE